MRRTNRITTIEFSEESLTGIRQDVQRINEEDALIEQIAKLASDELAKDAGLSYEDALKKVLNENTDISKRLDGIASYQKTRELLKMSSADALDYLVRLKKGGDASLSYSEAFSEVQLEYPGLMLDYMKEM